MVGLVMSVWALLPPYSGPGLNTETRVEVADHVIPSLVLIVASMTVLVSSRRRAITGALSLGSGFLVALAGLWMVATHLPLLAQAANGTNAVTWSAAIYHFAPSLAVLVLGLVWVGAYWSEAPA